MEQNEQNVNILEKSVCTRYLLKRGREKQKIVTEKVWKYENSLKIKIKKTFQWQRLLIEKVKLIFYSSSLWSDVLSQGNNSFYCNSFAKFCCNFLIKNPNNSSEIYKGKGNVTNVVEILLYDVSR